VVKRLLRERISVKDMVTILETLADQSSQTKNVDVLTEYCRNALAETITNMYRTPDNELHVVVLNSQLESHLIGQAQQGMLNSNTLGLTHDTLETLYRNASKTFEAMMQGGMEPVLLTSPVLRATLFDFLVPMLPEITVLSYNNISTDVQIKTFDRITLNQPELAEQAAP